MYDLLESLEEVESVTLAHPLKVRAIAEAKIKTDKIDAETLAQLLRVNLIPAAYIPGKETREIKEMIRQRVFLVRMRTRLKNRVHVLLDRLHIPLPAVSDLFGQRGLRYLRDLQLEGVDQEMLKEDLDLLEVFNRLIHIVWHVLTEKRRYEERPLRTLKQVITKDLTPAALATA